MYAAAQKDPFPCEKHQAAPTTAYGFEQDLCDVSSCSSIHKAHNPLVALLALGHFQHLLHLAVHAVLHLPAGKYITSDLLLLHMH